MQYSLRHYRAQAESHSHSDFHQIIISDLGKLELEVDGRGGEVLGRQLAFVEAGRTHAYRAEGLNRFLVLDVDVDLASQTGLEAVWQQRSHAATYLEVKAGHQSRLLDLLSPKNPAQFQPGSKSGAEMLGVIKAVLSQTQELGAASPNSCDGLPARLLRVMAWAEMRLGEHITIADLARVAVLSESSLFAAFQSHLRTSPMRWLTDQRLLMAHALVQDQSVSLSMADVSRRVGFSNQGAFSRAFSKRFGCAPTKIRHRAIGSQPI